MNITDEYSGAGGHYIVYQSEGSSRYNVGKKKRDGKHKFIRGHATRAAAKFHAVSLSNASTKRGLI